MTILLVDDERDIRTVARLALRQLGGFTVVEAASGREALEAVARARPDAVILDVMMPEMDGPEVLAALRARPDTVDIPVMFLTAKAMPEELARLRALGVLAIHTKPFDPEEFVTAVRRALEGAGTSGTVAGTATVASPPGPPGAADVDLGALRKLQGLTTESGGSLAAELIELFAGNTPGVLHQLRTLLQSGPAANREVERLAHALKSSALTLGATGMAAAAREIENAAHEGRLAGVDPLLDRLAHDLGPTVARLRAHVT
jgi:CheY-like chemotaxis protein/HPt (histidine-containing phosphotransfer) domain-containing protein